MAKSNDDLEILSPTKIAAGQFALYETPEGGMHMTLQLEGEEEAKHFDIPAMALKMFPGANTLLKNRR